MDMKQLLPALAPALTIACLALGAPGMAVADVKTGVDAWQRGDFDAAVRQWRPAAQAGDADAQFNLGQAYKLGRGVPMDLDIAMEWFRKAAAQGHLQAEDNYALLLFRSGRHADAMPYIQRAAARGEPRAQYILGTALFNGENVGKDWVRAYAMMTRAVAQGLPQATTSLALMDQYIPLDQRQEGIRLAAQLEQQERSNALAATQMPPQPAPAPSVATTKPASGKPAPIKSAPPPPSAIASAEPPARTEPQPAPAPAPAPAAKPETPAKPQPEKAPAPAPTPAPKPAAKAEAKPASGDWRVQLGAFSEEARARALWSDMSGRIKALAGLQPYIVKDGKLARLQAGPIESEDAAQKLCSALKAANAPCLVKKK